MVLLCTVGCSNSIVSFRMCLISLKETPSEKAVAGPVTVSVVVAVPFYYICIDHKISFVKNHHLNVRKTQL